MSQYSAKERVVARLLSATPGLKRSVKRAYVTLNAMLYRKPYKFRVLDPRCGAIESCVPEGMSFYSYYDRSPERNGRIAFHVPGIDTSRLPEASVPVELHVRTYATGSDIKIGETASYNWQQGARMLWIDDNTLIYNDCRNDRYCAVIRDATNGSERGCLPEPVQELVGHDSYLSVNPRRITALQPDYGYRNLPKMTDAELADLAHDGIKRVSLTDGKVEMVHTLLDVVNTESESGPANARHCLNHVMASPSGSKFIFIHRWYENGRRHDRLILSDYSNLKVLADYGMVSHMVWVDEHTLFGYFRHKDTDGFHFIDTENGLITPCEEANALGQGDGHPSVHGNWVVFDSYPDRSRMQHLTLLNLKNHTIIPLLEIYHGLKYDRQTRCDLHPRFSDNGEKIWFDTVYDDVRQLAAIDVSAITKRDK